MRCSESFFLLFYFNRLFMLCMYIYNILILIQNWLSHQVFWRTHFNNHGLFCLYSYHIISPVLLVVMSPVPSCFPTFFLPTVTVYHFISLPCFLGSLSCSPPFLQGKARQGVPRKARQGKQVKGNTSSKPLLSHSPAMATLEKLSPSVTAEHDIT